ncbi:MAG: hypothetical protein RBR47_08180 [Bacteroidales bacterium]|jgi:hypothetical protein|nr:hypothetical protein [Bacteroidales bacterium]NCU36319.1 hypothetical protein [Candidatus Falkowbacteria bacterium]MDD2633657.1 hypothetical protein [Bacteroidales bacterium]MDD3525974.1 hypothetical protein [Bacteroidales bacterium]MDD4175542.1 hypothetical protein [Bacteroidales bacterium]
MKKIIVSIIILAALFTGCKKEVNSPVSENENSSNIEKLILDFRQKLTVSQKEGSIYSADSAVWYVEALLNYSFCEAGNLCHSIVVDTLETTLNDAGANGYTIEQLQMVYDSLYQIILSHQPDNKIVFAIDLYIYPDGNATVFATRTAFASLSEPLYKSIADTSGYWFWGADKGMCGPDFGLHEGIDASDVLENRISNTVSDIWSSLEVRGAFPSTYIDPNFPFDITYLLPTRMFSALGPFIDVLEFCIPPAVMDYYLSKEGIWFIINDLQPHGKTFAYCDLFAGVLDNLHVVHAGEFTYGIPVN